MESRGDERNFRRSRSRRRRDGLFDRLSPDGRPGLFRPRAGDREGLFLRQISHRAVAELRAPAVFAADQYPRRLVRRRVPREGAGDARRRRRRGPSAAGRERLPVSGQRGRGRHPQRQPRGPTARGGQRRSAEGRRNRRALSLHLDRRRRARRARPLGRGLVRLLPIAAGVPPQGAQSGRRLSRG